jgi:hypothetical protein
MTVALGIGGLGLQVSEQMWRRKVWRYERDEKSIQSQKGKLLPDEKENCENWQGREGFEERAPRKQVTVVKFVALGGLICSAGFLWRKVKRHRPARIARPPC